MSSRVSYAIAVLILLLATGLRMWELTTVPIGLHAEEVLTLRLSDTVRAGDIRVFYPVGGGDARENLYYTALAFTRLGTGTGSIGYRMMSVLANIVMLTLVYTTGVRLFGRVAGLSAMALLAVMLWASLLARLIVIQAFLPLLVVAVMLVLARALPVYRRYTTESTNITSFAVLGALLGMSFYLHAASLMIVLGAMTFITYIILTERPLSTRRLSYIGFSILIIFILVTPYLLSSINLPDLAAGSRLFESSTGLLRSMWTGFLGIGIQGDLNPAFNIPGRPLIGPISSILALIGLIACIRNWRQPRYAVLLIMLIFMIPTGFIAVAPPNFLAMSVLLPPIALCFGLGVQIVIGWLRRPLYQRLAVVGLVGLILGNAIWTAYDLFTVWPQNEDMQVAYQSDLGHLALHIDQTAGTLPTVICHQRYDDFTRYRRLNNTQLVLLMMNRPTSDVRFVDCRQSLVFADGGGHQQVIVAGENEVFRIHPSIANWLRIGRPLLDPNLPENSVIDMDIQQTVADEMGKFVTISPARFNAPDGQWTPPPIRFGGNVTWLGYESNELPVYQPGDTVAVTNYWRIEGVIPPDLTFFNHILSDPVTIVAQRDELSMDAGRLRERDIVAQVTFIELPEAISDGTYTLSVGAYQWTSRLRLDALLDDEPQSNSLILYNINVLSNR
ncbi:MAG: hypothetical protein CL607_02890 [Anaerolineaceae bacterium]|nr:hypothetical protein [Anaerolineaceae bacterium]